MLQKYYKKIAKILQKLHVEKGGMLRNRNEKKRIFGNFVNQIVKKRLKSRLSVEKENTNRVDLLNS